MRVAAGVLLIMMALVNAGAGILYLAGGGLSTVAGNVADEVAKEGGEGAAGAKKAGEEVKLVGAKLYGMSAFLIALLGLQIAAAVFLFMNKKAGFIMVVAGLGLLAEVLGIVLTVFGMLNAFGIVVAIFAFLGANAVKSGAPKPA